MIALYSFAFAGFLAGAAAVVAGAGAGANYTF